MTSTGKMLTSLCIYLFLLYATAVLLYPVIFTREYSFCVKQDNLHQTYPYFNKLASSLHKGYLPTWDANTSGGKSFVGEIQPGIFYPLNILWCFLFGSASGISVYYIDLLTALHFLICLIGMYKAARTFLLPSFPAIATALIFTFTGAVAARAGGQTGIFFGLTLLPWSVYFTARYYMDRRHKKFLLFSGLVAGLEILAGHMQPFFHTMIINGIIILFFEFKDRRTWKAFLVASGINFSLLLVLAFIVTLPQLYYSSQYLSDVYRSVGPGGILAAPGGKVPLDIYTHRHIINLYNLPNLLGQDFTKPEDDNIIYMGILPLLLFILYLVRHRRLTLSPAHAAITRLLLIILAVGTVCVLGYLTFIPFILHQLPFVSVVRQLGRYMILISFSASLLAGLGIAYISQIKEWLFQHHTKVKLYVLAFLGINALYWIIVQSNVIPIAVSIPFLCCFLFLIAGMKMKKITEITVLAIAVISIDLYVNKPSYSPIDNEFYADRYYGRNRIIDSLEHTYGQYRVAFDMSNYAFERRNLGNMYNIQTTWGYSATYNKEYLDFINTDPRPDSETGDLLNIRYIISDKTQGAGFVLKDSIEGMKLYEKKNYYPRMYWQHQLGMPGPAIEAANKGTIRQTAYSDLYQRIEIDCPARDTLIISENSYPGWKCFDNRKEIPIRPAKIKNYPPLFRSVVLDKGHHIVEFRYNKVFYWF
ncbi:hypothetical protein Q4E93_20880 [Flavitalea sp. BT771]|uniref:hypothetical protein n=1 Tax=Flavitalea sp. BT771 TaxID=3063329 RepID=UPI0026E224B4|nr:hypothetical protein [Flavitalea sp. BT771]MDO6433076.1 hypothetical protein [Flavitalea sp. BT771]MDV6221648.1 hypothetical protein [Flavitalea sp. BT771]